MSKLQWRKHKDGSETAGPFRIVTEAGMWGSQMYMELFGTRIGSWVWPAYRGSLKRRALRIARACAAALKEKP